VSGALIIDLASSMACDPGTVVISWHVSSSRIAMSQMYKVFFSGHSLRILRPQPDT